MQPIEITAGITEDWIYLYNLSVDGLQQISRELHEIYKAKKIPRLTPGDLLDMWGIKLLLILQF
jgi:hypothetical protein